MKITQEVWDEIKVWYEASPIIEMLRPSDSGYVIKLGDTLVASGFLIKTNAQFAMMECLRVNPAVSKITGGRGILKLVALIEQEAIKAGYKMILGFTETDNKSIQKMHQKVFKACKGSDVTLIYKELKGEI